MTDPALPLTDDQWPDDIADLLAGFAGALNVYRVMAHHPGLLRAWAPLRQHLVKDSALGPVRSEVVILRTGVRLGSAYEWAHHVSRSRQLGMTDARIASIRDAPEGEDAVICQAVDALFDLRRLPPDLDQALTALLGRHGVFDLIATVNFYSTLGALLMTYDTPIDAAIAEEMARAPL